MQLLYSLFILFLSPLLLVKFLKSFSARIRLKKHLSSCYWLHCASLGEVNAAKPLIKALQAQSKQPLVLSVFTTTGFKQAQSIEGVFVIYLPLDLLMITRLFVKNLGVKKLFILETELWPNLIKACLESGAQCYLVSARLSNKALSYYCRFKLFKKTIQSFEHIFCQDALNQTRFLSLGVNPKHLTMSGNLKFNLPERHQSSELKQQYPFGDRPVFLAASVREKEITAVLTAFLAIKKALPETVLLIAPRHVRSFQLVAKHCLEKNIRYQKRTSGEWQVETPVLLIDTLGELIDFYALANVVFVGGSLKPYGGHNFIEAAYYGDAAVVMGKYSDNFASEVAKFSQAEALLVVDDEKKLATTVIDLINDKKNNHRYASNAKRLIKDNQSRIDLILKTI